MKLLYCLLFLSLAAENLHAQDATAKLELAVQTYVDQEKFTGSVLVVHQGKILINKGYGLKNIASSQSNKPETIYSIASLTKTFTAAVVMKLQEQGKLSVNDKLSKYYNNYPNGDEITIHHLLSHTSGIKEYLRVPAFLKFDQTKPIPLNEMISVFRDQPLDFPPGTKFSYTNSGYTLLGYIIEKVTGMSYEKALQQLIFKPLDLKNTGYDFNRLNNSERATGYLNQNRITDPINASILYATGAVYSNVGDLYKWHKAFENNKFLSTETKQLINTPNKGPYGYGWYVDSLFGKKRISHDGNLSGFKSNINRIPEDDLCIIALSNSSSSRVGEMVRVLISILYDKPYQLPKIRPSISLPADELKELEGKYQIGPNSIISVSRENSRLFISGAGIMETEFFASARLTFFSKDNDMEIEFLRDPASGKITEATVLSGKRKLPGKKIQ